LLEWASAAELRFAELTNPPCDGSHKSKSTHTKKFDCVQPLFLFVPRRED